MEVLKVVLSHVKEFESITQLHALIFVAQELGYIPKEYEFNHSLNLPFSETLECDFLFLLHDQFLREGLSGEFIVEQLEIKDNGMVNINGIENLSKRKVIELLNMSRVLYLADRFPELKDDNIKLEEKARRTFLISKDSIQGIFDQFKMLSPNLRFSEV